MTGFSATERGNEEHARLQKIEWLDGVPDSELPEYLREPSPLRDALRKPVGAIDLWRERAFEILHEGKWISGVFDRVVFFEGRADIYDFKTNRKQQGETGAQFEERMAREYASQMGSYRLAISRLCTLPESAIRANLLLIETRAVLPVFI